MSWVITDQVKLDREFKDAEYDSVLTLQEDLMRLDQQYSFDREVLVTSHGKNLIEAIHARYKNTDRSIILGLFNLRVTELSVKNKGT